MDPMSTFRQIRVDPKAPLPLAAQVTQQLTWLIASGGLSEGDELPPARELAEQLGINFHTVRVAYQQLAADGLVSVTRGRRARVRSYDPERAVRSYPDAPSFAIGVIIPAFIPFYAPLLDGLEAAAARQPAMLFISNARDDPRTAANHVDRLAAKQVDGIVVASLDLTPPGKPPIVFVDSVGAPPPAIEFDLEGSQFLASSHLIWHGHSRIGYVTPPVGRHNVRPKHEGHLRALREAGLEPDPDLTVTVPRYDIASGTAGADRLLQMPNPPTAIAAATDALAIGAFHAITSAGLRLPDDIALTGNDGIEMAAIIRPALTTVSLPIRQAGQLAFEKLQQVIGGEPADATPLLLDVKLVVRETCGC